MKSFFFSSRRRHTSSVSAFLLNRSSDLYHQLYRLSRNCSKYRQQLYQYHEKYQPHQKQHRSEERFSRNAETDIVCRLLLEKKKRWIGHDAQIYGGNSGGPLVNLEVQIGGINEISRGLG